MVAFEFYTKEYLGSSISQEEWQVYEARAAAQLRKYKRIYTVRPQLASISYDGTGGIIIDADSIDATADSAGNVTLQPVVTPQDVCEAMAVCAMADVLAYYVAAQNGMGTVASASIGSVSVSYGSAANAVDLSPRGQEKELYRSASLYLDIYRGVGGC